ncbi:hypothetical protein D020_0658B, partial [Vibrio parahaemolyticus SBR10290]
ATHKAVL